MAIPPPGPKGEHVGQTQLRVLARGYVRVPDGPCRALRRCRRIRSRTLALHPGQRCAQVRELFFEREACLRKPEFVKDSNRGHWGDGLTTLEGPAWQARRRMLRPSFRARPVSARLPMVAQCTTDMLDAWAPETEADLPKELRILTARIAARVVLDAELEGYGPGEGRSGVLPFAEAYGEDYASTPGGDPTAPLVMVRPRAPRRMDTTIRIIDERIASGEERGDVLSDLVRARLPDGERLTRDEIVGEIIQMLYAGHLTIPSSLVNFWRDIAANDVAARIAAEADHLCATGAPGIGSSLGLLLSRRAEREHASASTGSHPLSRGGEPFELGGFEFARGVAVWVSPQLLHRDARYFPEPHRFLPERFIKRRLPGNAGSLYLPFGGGRRACIANHLALYQMTLISLLMAARFEPTRFAGGTSKEISYFLTPRNLKATVTWV